MCYARFWGYDFDYDDFHACVHGTLPYEKVKPDPVLRQLLLSLPQRKIVSPYTNKKVIQVVDPEIAITENIKLLYSITEIIAQCLNLDVDQRPEMTDVATHLYMLIRANHQSDQLLETQNINHDGNRIYTSNSTQVYNVGHFDIFDLTARQKIYQE